MSKKNNKIDLENGWFIEDITFNNLNVFHGRVVGKYKEQFFLGTINDGDVFIMNSKDFDSTFQYLIKTVVRDQYYKIEAKKNRKRNVS